MSVEILNQPRRRAGRWTAFLLAVTITAACGPSSASPNAAPPTRRPPATRTATADIGDELNFAPGATATALPRPSLTPVEDIGEELNFAPAGTPTLPPPPLQISRSVPDDLALQELTFSSGGAAVEPIIGSAVCDPPVTSGALSGHLGGVWSTFNRYDPASPFFWGARFTTCKAPVEVGDVVFFRLAVEDDSPDMQISLAGPDGSEDFGFAPVNYIQDRPNRFGPPVHSNGVQVAWLATRDLGVGAYELRVATLADSLTLPFEVVEPRGPAFGASFGPFNRPFVLAPYETIDVVFAGFAPNQMVDVLITQDGIATFEYGPHPRPPDTPVGSIPVASLSVTVDDTGYRAASLAWPADLPPGLYSLYVPAAVPETEFDALREFQWFSLQFAVMDSDAMTFTVYDPQLAGATADIFSDPSPAALVRSTFTTDTTGLRPTGPSVIIDGVRWLPIDAGAFGGWMRTDQIIEEFTN